METLENVKKALRLCSYDPDPYDDDQPCKMMVSCEICPYWDEEHGCRETDLFNDTLKLLDELEPRVLALEEVKVLTTDPEDNTPVWVETRTVTDRGVLTTFEASILWGVEDGWWRRFGPVHSGWEDRRAGNYGTTWRCWTSRPTDDQREAEPWER